MPTRKAEDSSIRKLTRVGQGSLAVTIPVAIVNKLNLRERQKVVVRERGGVITVKDWEKPNKT
ncbi:MAG TPA: AbrB/MazE/SpoVT family DNA-binding domain-containing protein [Candidatus Saccharimonadales bacterium]